MDGGGLGEGTLNGAIEGTPLEVVRPYMYSVREIDLDHISSWKEFIP